MLERQFAYSSNNLNSSSLLRGTFLTSMSCPKKTLKYLATQNLRIGSTHLVWRIIASSVTECSERDNYGQNSNRDLHTHPAGDVTRVSVMPRKVTVKIGDIENRCRGCRDKNR